MKALLIIIALCPLTAAAEIYRCETPDGPVYSDRVCGEEAIEVQVEETSGLDASVGLGVQVDLAEARLQRERQKYVNRIVKHRNAETGAIDAQIQALASQKARANNNLAGATYGAGIDQQMAALRAARAETQSTYQELITRAETDGL